MIMFTPKHVGAVLMKNFIFILRQFSCASVGEKINFDNTKMHGTTVEKKNGYKPLTSSRDLLYRI